MAVRINRSERKSPFLSNKIKPGRVEQLTPNGCAYDNDYPLIPADNMGAGNDMAPPPTSWPGGNRSGE